MNRPIFDNFWHRSPDHIPVYIISRRMDRVYSGNDVRHINEVKLRRARCILGLATTFGGSSIPVFIRATQAHSAWPSHRG